MGESEFHPSECCMTCPHFDEFSRTCTHDLRQAIVQEMVNESNPSCPVFPRIRAQSMQELEQRLSP